MIGRLSRPAQRALALLLLVAAAGLAVGCLGGPVWWLNQRYDRVIEDLEGKNARFTRLASHRQGIDAALAAVEQRDLAGQYLSGASESLVAAELQNQVTRLVESQQGKIISSQIPQIGEAKPHEDSRRLAITVQFSAAALPLQMVLHAVETHRPFLFIDQLTVRSPVGRVFKPVPGTQPEYNVQLTVSAYARIAATPAGAAP